jgi:hypothetical protein
MVVHQHIDQHPDDDDDEVTGFCVNQTIKRLPGSPCAAALTQSLIRLRPPSVDAPPLWKRFGPQPHVDVSRGVEARRQRSALVKHGTLVPQEPSNRSSSVWLYVEVGDVQRMPSVD